MENYISIGKAAKYLGVSINTLRVWEKKKILVPERTPTGHRRYKMSQVGSFEGKKYSRIQNTVFLYARVSTQKQADAGNLDRQIGRLTEYASNNKYAIQAVFRDIASGLNGKRGGRVAKKLSKVIESEVTTSEDNGDGNNPGTDS
ncbi:MerR family DNA-binding transcriptional regulator [Desulfofarcimen acetoxidans]|uniref:MerR family DNA-binding transcriptional regulator n=1 Tax=Desulfofarcimen acetoxidans TaxID=58138 RepID=UPI00019E5B9E|nr:MerR family DNA-binding transcriptional regulator [Desulfofarcimen acetoxidans]